MSTPKSPKQVKVHADGCSPSNLELFVGKDSVVFVQSEAGAPTTIHVSSPSLFGTSTCTVGKSPTEAPAYPAQAAGNFTLGIAPGSAGKGAVQVLCLGITGPMGAGDSGSIKVGG